MDRLVSDSIWFSTSSIAMARSTKSRLSAAPNGSGSFIRHSLYATIDLRTITLTSKAHDQRIRSAAKAGSCRAGNVLVKNSYSAAASYPLPRYP